MDPSLSTMSSLSGSIENLGGPFGAYLSDALFSVAGIGAYLILLILSFVAVRLLFFYQPSNRMHKTIKFISGIVLISSFSSLCEYYYSGDFFPQSSSGGLIGNLVFTNLSNIFGVVGSLIFIVIFFLASISLTFSFSWLSVIDVIGKGAKYSFFQFNAKSKQAIQFIVNSIKSIDFSRFRSENKPVLDRSIADAKPRELNLPKSSPSVDAKPQEITRSVTKTETPKAESSVSSTVYKSKEKNSNTAMPSTDLLDRVLDDGSSLTKEQLDEVADRLAIKLQEFGVEAKVVSVIPGPVVTRFEIQPAPGTKASKITNIAQDIARSLAVMSVRVVEVTPGKSVF